MLQARLDADPTDLAAALSSRSSPTAPATPRRCSHPSTPPRPPWPPTRWATRSRAGQERLFGLLLTAELVHAHWAARDSRGAGFPARGPTTRWASRPRRSTGCLRRTMAMVALTPDQHDAPVLMRSRVHEHLGRVAEAVADLRACSPTPARAGAVWELAGRRACRRRSTPSPARPPARPARTRGLRPLRARGGRRARHDGRHETPARSKRSPAAPTPARPSGPGSPAHRPRAQAAESLALDRALDRGLHAAAAMRAVGITPPTPSPWASCSAALRSKSRHNRLDTAAELLLRSAAEWPGVPITSAGAAPLDRGAMADTLRGPRPARDGPRSVTRPPASPSCSTAGCSCRALDRRRCLRRQARRHYAQGPDAWACVLDASGRPVADWTALTGAKPVLVRFDPDRVLLLEPDDRGGTLRAIFPPTDATSGASSGSARSSRSARGPATVTGQEALRDPARRRGGRDRYAAGPRRGHAGHRLPRRAHGRHRPGHRAQSGWTVRTNCQQVSDASAGEGVVAIGGVGSPHGDAAGEPVRGAAGAWRRARK